MRSLLSTGLAVTLLAAVTGCAPGDVAPLTERLTGDWVTAYNANDATALSQLYEEDAVLLTTYAPPVQGRTPIEEFWGADATTGISTDITVEHADAEGALATISGLYDVKVGDASIGGGRFLQVWKESGGTWLIHRDVWIEDTSNPPDDVMAKWLSAYNSGDAKVLGALYTDDAEVVTTTSGAVKGREAILSLWEFDIKSDPVTTEMTEEDRYVRGRTAFLSGLYTVKSRANGKTVAGGHYSQLWTRDGADWKVHREIWVTRPTAGGAASTN